MSRASDFEGLEKDCAKAYTERVKDIKRIKRDTKSFIKGAQKETKDMADALHKKIDTDEAARKSKDTKEINAIKADTKKLIADDGKSRKDMSAALHEKIDTEEAARKAKDTKEINAIKASTKKLIADDKVSRKEMAEDVAKEVAGYKRERVAAGKSWKGLVKTMAEKRGGKVAKKPAGPPAERAVAKKPAKAPAPAGDAAKVMFLVKANAAGIKLTEIEKKTGLARIKAARVLRGLIDDGKITKEELLYKPL